MNRTKKLIGYSIYDLPKKCVPFVLNVLNKKYLMEWGRICQIWNLQKEKNRFCATLRCATEINLDMTNSTHPLVNRHSSLVLGRNQGLLSSLRDPITNFEFLNLVYDISVFHQIQTMKIRKPLGFKDSTKFGTFTWKTLTFFHLKQSHYREVLRWEIFTEQELRFGLDLGQMANFPAFIALKSVDL